MVGRLSALKPFRLAELTHIARQVAADSRHPELFEDIVQEACLSWLFLSARGVLDGLALLDIVSYTHCDESWLEVRADAL